MRLSIVGLIICLLWNRNIVYSVCLHYHYQTLLYKQLCDWYVCELCDLSYGTQQYHKILCNHKYRPKIRSRAQIYSTHVTNYKINVRCVLTYIFMYLINCLRQSITL